MTYLSVNYNTCLSFNIRVLYYERKGINVISSHALENSRRSDNSFFFTGLIVRFLLFGNKLVYVFYF